MRQVIKKGEERIKLGRPRSTKYRCGHPHAGTKKKMLTKTFGFWNSFRYFPRLDLMHFVFLGKVYLLLRKKKKTHDHNNTENRSCSHPISCCWPLNLNNLGDAHQLKGSVVRPQKLWWGLEAQNTLHWSVTHRLYLMLWQYRISQLVETKNCSTNVLAITWTH